MNNLKTKLALIFLLFGVLAVGFVSLISDKDACEEFGVIYLKPNETMYASELSNKENAVISTPELSRVTGRTEMLECSLFDYKNFVNFDID